jgi:hypothetical protein
MCSVQVMSTKSVDDSSSALSIGSVVVDVVDKTRILCKQDILSCVQKDASATLWMYRGMLYKYCTRGSGFLTQIQ